MATTQPLTALFTDALNGALAKIIELDPAAAEALQPHRGKSIELLIQPLKLRLRLVIDEAQVKFTDAPEGEADTRIEGTPTGLFALGTKQHIAGLPPVQISGDASTGQFFADWLKNLRPDWEEGLCRVFGDGPGHRMATVLTGVGQRAQSLLQSLLRNGTDYLTEESRELIHPDEMEEFLDAVDDLNADLAHAERRLQTLLDAAAR